MKDELDGKIKNIFYINSTKIQLWDKNDENKAAKTEIWRL